MATWPSTVGAAQSPTCSTAEAGAHLDDRGQLDARASRDDRCVEREPTDSGATTYPYNIRLIADAPLDFDPCADGEVYAAIEVRTIRFAGDEGLVAYNDLDCVPYGLAGVDLAQPSGDLVWDEVSRQLPMTPPQANPDAGGIVGVETWLWVDPEGLEPIDHDGDPATPPAWGTTVTATVVGVSATATVWVEEYRWTVDDGVVLTSPVPGTEDDPAVTHTYQRKGPRTLRVDTVWRGRWESPVGSGDLGPAVLTGAPLDYHVYEVRAVPGGS